MKIERKIDHIKVLESSIETAERNIRCSHCKERNALVSKKGDNNNLFCVNCGNLTPTRSIKHGRGIAAPSIQQPSVIVQPENSKRKPRGINRTKSELEESLLSRGYQVIDVNYVEPTPR